jgi:hypothetical protein
VNAIRNGQKRDGTFYGPPMSFGWYKRMSDTDDTRDRRLS